MSRNRPFGDLFVSGRNPQLQRTASGNPPLTPRTPHSRSGRAEEGYTEVELDELRDHDTDDDSPASVQSQPLLSALSTSTTSSGYRSRGDDHDIWARESGLKYCLALAVERSPLVVGTLLLCVALAMTLLSLRKATLEAPVDPQLHIGHTFPSMPSPHEQEAALSHEVPHPLQSSAPTRVISYENHTKFPLSGTEYNRECEKLMSGFMHHAGYWVPPNMGPLDVPHREDVVGGKVCRSTITYMLDGHVGLAADLALMAQVAGMARQRDRTFLVDDTYWNRGKWTDHFVDVRQLQPGPDPGCLPPPPEELVACPRTARHWVVSSRTAKYHLGRTYDEEYEDPYSLGINRQKPIFTRALESFSETIRPNAQNMALIQAARAEIGSVLNLHPSDDNTASDNHPEQLRTHTDPYIAVHIRRGDRKAESWAFHKSYVPLEHSVAAARDAWTRLYPDIPPQQPSPHFPAPPITYVASDSIDVLREYVAAFPPETAMFALSLSTNPGLRALAPHNHGYVQAQFVTEEEAERVLLTRGMVVDLALLSGLWAAEGDIVPGAVVCTISSNVCKISAVGLGWDRAFGFDDNTDHTMGVIEENRKRWVEIDNKDAVSPEWRGFELF